MMSKLAEEFGNLNREDFQQIHYLNTGNQNAMTIPSQRFEMQLLRIGEMAARIYDMYCEVWRCQQRDLSPDFLRAVSNNGIRMLISARTGSFIFELGLEHQRTNRPDSQWLKAATQSFKRNTELLLGEWQRIAEIDGKTLEYMLAGTPSNPVACEIATQIVHARTQLRILDTKIASLKARIRMSELALSAMQTRPPDAYRMTSIEQMHERLVAEKDQCENRRDRWQGKLDAAMSRSTEVKVESSSKSASQNDGQSAITPPSEIAAGVSKIAPQHGLTPLVGAEKDISQALERVRHFEAEIAAVDTKIAALQQSLTEAIVKGTSTFKPRDIEKAIHKLHADKKELEFRRDDWHLNLSTARWRLEQVNRRNNPAQGSGSDRTPSDAQPWHQLHVQFRSLAEEELKRDPHNKRDAWLRAYITRDKQEGEQWSLSKGVDEGFKARFEALSARAGIALGIQFNGRLGLESWLHCLFEDLLVHNSPELFAADDTGGIILRVCEASATYTARLEREALEQGGMIKPASASGQKRLTGARTAGARSSLNYRSELKNVIALNFAKNPTASDLDICRALDSDGAVELPASWQTGENRLFERAYKNPQTRRKVEITISKVRNQMRKEGLLG